MNNNINRSKRKKIIVIVIIVALLVLTPIIACGIYELYLHIYNTTADIKLDENADSFFDNTYASYNGGKDAQLFFNEYAYVDEYKDIDFHYIDGEKIKHYYNFWTVFVLDVYYEKEDYNNHFDNITKNSDECVSQGKLSISSDSYYDMYRVKKSNTTYTNNSAYILFHPQYNTVRYVFVLNEDIESFELKDIVDRSIELKWNDPSESETNNSHSDWIFDYSDIIGIETSEESSTVITE